MEKVTVIGLDLAKNVFQVHGADAKGRKCFSRKLKRSQVLEFFVKLPPVLVGMEACGGAHEWARRLLVQGHQVKLMAPQRVKPFVVQGNKTDARDAAGIAEAAVRESVPAVQIRTRESQQMQALHRTRELWMKQRVATCNQIRGLLNEFGEVIPKGSKSLGREVALWQERADPSMSVLKTLVEELMAHRKGLEERISRLEVQIKQLHKENAASKQIETVPGVGLLTATAVIASFGRCEGFASGRNFASCVGLTPREHSSGDKQTRLGISKRGNPYLRKLLVQGARSVLKVHMNNPAHAQDWEVRLAKRRGHNIAAVALAAKNARRIWALLRTGEKFDPEHVHDRMAKA